MGKKLKNKKYTKQSYWIDRKFTEKNFGKWAIVVIDKNDLRVASWAKSLSEAMVVGNDILEPIYFMCSSSASGLFVPVSVGYKNKQITILSSVDTGAGISTFSSEVAEVLGINLKKYKKEKIHGISGFFDAYTVNNIKIQLPNEKIAVSFMVNFVNKKDVPSLLGCAGFLDFYEVCFNPKYGMKFRFIG